MCIPMFALCNVRNFTSTDVCVPCFGLLGIFLLRFHIIKVQTAHKRISSWGIKLWFSLRSHESKYRAVNAILALLLPKNSATVPNCYFLAMSLHWLECHFLSMLTQLLDSHRWIKNSRRSNTYNWMSNTMIVPYHWIKTLDLENIHPFYSLLPSYTQPSSPPLSHGLTYSIFSLSLPDSSIDLPLSHTNSLSHTPANQWCSPTKMVLSLSHADDCGFTMENDAPPFHIWGFQVF